MTIRIRPLFGAALLVGVTGCAGGQTGEEETASCVETSTELAADEVSSLGFSPNDVRNFIEGTHGASFEWQPSPKPYGPESGPSELTLGVTSLGTSRFVERQPNTVATASQEAGSCCPEGVQLDVRIQLRTSGGALNETFNAVIEAQRASSASLMVLLAPELQGSLSFDQMALGKAKIEDFLLDAHFGPQDFSGTLHVRLEETSGASDSNASISLTTLGLAQWGEAPGNLPLCAE
jgi:hypothetical protein